MESGETKETTKLIEKKTRERNMTLAILTNCGVWISFDENISVRVFRLRSDLTSCWRATGTSCSRATKQPCVVYEDEQRGVGEEEGGKRDQRSEGNWKDGRKGRAFQTQPRQIRRRDDHGGQGRGENEWRSCHV